MAGFSLMELLILVAIIGILGAVATNAWLSTMPRLMLKGAVTTTMQVLRKARMHAIKKGVNTVVQLDPDNTIMVFADWNRNLVFDPVAGVPVERTDFVLSHNALPGTVVFGYNPGDVADPALFDLSPTSGLTGGVAGRALVVYNTNGTLRDTGAIRLNLSGTFNTIEIAMTNTAGRMIRRKYMDAGFSPDGTLGFFPEGNSLNGAGFVVKNSWFWY
jgi:type II secretory pathway pseudopilin PulG